jgi:hypothetical protein
VGAWGAGGVVSTEAVGWIFAAFIGIVLSALGLVFGIIPELNRRENQKTQRLMYMIAQMLRQEISLIPDLVRIVEDLMRMDPERAEAMHVTRIELLQKRADFQEVVDRLENRWDA